LSAGNRHDAPEGRELVKAMGKSKKKIPILMDKAYEGDETRKTMRQNGYKPVVPPKSNRKKPWKYNKKQYKQRNIVERFFRRIKQFRKVFTRYDKLDTVYISFVYLAMICILLK